MAIYFCIADFVLISQCLYYNHLNARLRQSSVTSAVSDNENEPLLARRRSSDATGLPGSHRRRSSARSGHQRRDSLSKILEEDDEGNAWVKNSLSILAVIAVGTAGWAIAWQGGVWKPVPENGDEGSVAVGAKILGYASAVCYLGYALPLKSFKALQTNNFSARIPQILKNYRDKSCEGLALLFFLLSLMGNLTYGAGILAHSLEKDYLWVNLPWLIGSLGTMAEDAIIFIQFRMYKAPTVVDATAVE